MAGRPEKPVPAKIVHGLRFRLKAYRRKLVSKNALIKNQKKRIRFLREKLTQVMRVANPALVRDQHMANQFGQRADDSE
eukprot:6090866-Pyramimonas_sp.AAC.1